jgi:hypothetical protein
MLRSRSGTHALGSRAGNACLEVPWGDEHNPMADVVQPQYQDAGRVDTMKDEERWVRHMDTSMMQPYADCY